MSQCWHMLLALWYCRARLESTMQRLGRVVTAMEEDKARSSSPPRTVERALRGGRAWGMPGAGGTGTPVGFGRDDGGAGDTRRRLASGLQVQAC